MASTDEFPSGERWLGAQEAARYLGIHRSTLNLAVRRGTLVPDRTTPGGHLRFRQETLDRFTEHLRRGPVTRDVSAVGPLDVLTGISSGIAASARAVEICRAAAASILRAQMDFEAVAILLLKRDEDPPRLKLITHPGFSAKFTDELERLLAAGAELVTTRVMRTAGPAIVRDAERVTLPSGSSHLARLAGKRAFAVYPLGRGRQAIGVLLAASSTPRAFATSDRRFLEAIASELSLAVYAEQYLDLTCWLMETAMGRSTGPELTDGRAIGRLSELRDLLIRHTEAEDACALGFDDGGALATRSPRLCALAEEARRRHETVTRRLRLRHTLYTGTAVWVPLYDRRDASVAVLWQGKRPNSPADSALLMVFAGACALASGRVRLESGGEPGRAWPGGSRG